MKHCRHYIYLPCNVINSSSPTFTSILVEIDFIIDLTQVF